MQAPRGSTPVESLRGASPSYSSGISSSTTTQATENTNKEYRFASPSPPPSVTTSSTMEHLVNGAGRMTMAGGGSDNPQQAGMDLHELAKGWKAAIARALDATTRHEAQISNDRGNLPLHSAASFRAPLEVSEALLDAYPEGARQTNNYGNLALHFTAWKKGPLDVEKLLLRIYPEGAAQKNNHGNLPLHYAAHYNAPLEVVEALYNAYPEAALQKNNDSNTPLDLAIADGASPNVVALLQGKTVPPSDGEVLDSSKGKCERMEKDLQKAIEGSGSAKGDLAAVLALLMEVHKGHPHALFSTGIDPDKVHDVETLLEQVRIAEEPVSSSTNNPAKIEQEEMRTIEDALLPPDDEVEQTLCKIVALDAFKNQIRGLRRTIEMRNLAEDDYDPVSPLHLSLVGNPGTGKTFVARLLGIILSQIGAVPKESFIEVNRCDLVDRRSEERTRQKTKKILEDAKGGVLFVDEPYTLLPSSARKNDFGGAALRELAKVLPVGDPLLIFAGDSKDIQMVMASDVGFKGNVLLQLELEDPSPADLARIFFTKLYSKGLVPEPGLTVNFLADLFLQNTEEEWRLDRNGHICDLLLNAVRVEIKNKLVGDDNASRVSISPLKNLPAPGSKRVTTCPPEEVIVTIEDIQTVVLAGL